MVNNTRTATRSARYDSTPVDVRDLGLIDYHQAWDLQRELAARRAEGAGADTLLLLEHPSVYTAGRRTEAADRPTDGSPVIDVDRGGKITWHGPGQLVGYPIIRLAEPIDVVDYVRRLEQAIIHTVTDLGVECGRVPGRSGVWLAASGLLPERKIASIGIRVQRGVTLHGISLNCDPDLGAFGAIIPCGIRDVGSTSLSRELGRAVTVAEVRPSIVKHILAALDGELPVTEHDIPHAGTPGVADPAAATAAREPKGPLV